MSFFRHSKTQQMRFDILIDENKQQLMSTDADRDTVQTKPDECFLSMQVNATLNKCNLTHAYLTAIFICENYK